MAEDLIAELQHRLATHPAERYPIQHATTQFHLGTAYLHRGDPDRAIDSFRRSAELFEPLPLEQAKSHTMTGVALRDAGRPADAAAAFERAVVALASVDAPLEEAAARHNLGLVRSQLGEPASAHFAAALDLFRSAGATRQASAAARELGQALLVEGRIDDAVAVLEAAVPAADAVGDEAGRGAAANALGLARLAQGDDAAAVDAFRAARAAHPRSLRPAQHAMAAANLAIALERAGRAPEARLAARQARAVPGADEPVRAQSAGVLDRLGDPADDLLVVVSSTPPERWSVLLRDELERWADDTVDARCRASAAVAAALGRPGAGDDLAEAVLRAALELPPDRAGSVLGALSSSVAELGAEDAGRARARLGRSSARFHLPQMMRLEELLRPPAPPAEGGA